MAREAVDWLTAADAVQRQRWGWSSPREVMVPMEGDDPMSATAVVYCEARFGTDDGKTANGLVRHSEKYEILSVVDSA